MISINFYHLLGKPAEMQRKITKLINMRNPLEADRRKGKAERE